MINSDYVGSWEIRFGYCTGNPLDGNDGWFTTKQTFINKTLGKALWEARKEGYRISDDICADFLFHVKDLLNGQMLDEVDTAMAMVEANQLLKDETEQEINKITNDFVNIELTDEGLMGRYEDSDCYNASPLELGDLIDKLSGKVKRLKKLKSLIEEYGLNVLVAWKKDLNFLMQIKEKIKARDRYEAENKNQGNYYKEGCNKMDSLQQDRINGERFCSKIPLKVKKYFEEK